MFETWMAGVWLELGQRDHLGQQIHQSLVGHTYLFNKCFLGIKCMPGNFTGITVMNKQIRCLLFREIDNKQIHKQDVQVGEELSRRVVRESLSVR